MHSVIPGRAGGANPEPTTGFTFAIMGLQRAHPNVGSGFFAPRSPGMTVRFSSTYPA